MTGTGSLGVIRRSHEPRRGDSAARQRTNLAPDRIESSPARCGRARPRTVKKGRWWSSSRTLCARYRLALPHEPRSGLLLRHSLRPFGAVPEFVRCGHHDRDPRPALPDLLESRWLRALAGNLHPGSLSYARPIPDSPALPARVASQSAAALASANV